MYGPEEREDGGVYEEGISSVSEDVKNAKPDRLPGLTCVVNASLSSTGGMFLTLKGQCKPHGLGIISGESCSKLILHCTKWGF